MKSIYQMELEDKFNRKIKYREKKLKNQRMIIGKQQVEIERLNNIINEFDKWLEANLTNLEKEETSNIYNEGLKQGMLSNGRLIKNKLQELKGNDKE